MANNLKINVQADTSSAKAKLGSVEDAIKKVQTSQGSLTGAVGKFTAASPYVAAAGVAVLALKKMGDAVIECVGSSNEFNKSMANIATLIPNNAKRIDTLSNSILDLSVKTGKTTDDLTAGAYQVVSAFGDTEDTMNYLTIAANGATAGMSSTEEMLSLISATMKGYGEVSVEAAQHTSDLAFEAVKLGQTTIPALSSAIMKVTDNSSKLGITEEELYTTFATLTGVTGEAAEVSTQFKSTQTALLSPTDALKKAYTALGISSSKSMIKQNGLAGSMKLIAEYAEANNIPLQDLVGSTEAMTFVSAIGTKQNETYNKKLVEMGSASGSTNEALNEVTSGVNSLGFEIDQNKAKWEKLKVKIGEDFNPVASLTVGFLGDILTNLNGGKIATDEMKTSTDKIVSSSDDYNTILEKLNGKLSEQERLELSLAKIRKSAEIQTTFKEFTGSYKDNQKTKQKAEIEIETSQTQKDAFEKDLKSYAKALNIEFKPDINFKDLYEKVEKEHPSKHLNSLLQGYVESSSSFDTSSTKLKKIVDEETLSIKELSSAVSDGSLNIDTLQFKNKPLYDQIMANVEAYKKEKAALEAKNKAYGVDTPEGHDHTGDSPSTPITPATPVDDTEIKNNKTVIAQWKLKNDLLNANTELEALEINRASDLADYTAEEVDARAAVNAYYNTQKTKIEEELAQKEASNKLDDYKSKLDEQKATAQLVYNNLVVAGATFEELKQASINSLIAEKNDAMDEAITKYGEQSDYVKELGKSYDDQIEAEKKSKEINSKISDYLKDNKDLLSDETKLKEEIKAIDDSILAAQELLITANENEKKSILETIDTLKKKKSALTDTTTESTWADDVANFLDPSDGAKEFQENWEKTFGSLADTYGSYVTDIMDGIDAITSAQIKADQSILDNEQNTWNAEADEQQGKIDDQVKTSDKIVTELENQYDAGALSYEDYIARKTEATAEGNAAQEALDTEKEAKEAEFLARQNELDKKTFNADKKNQIAQILMNTATAIIKGYAQLGPIAGSVAAVGTGVVSGLQIAAVSKQNFVPALAEGGVATKPTMALIGEGGEPEMVLPLSKAKEQGFGGGGTGQTINVYMNGNTYLTKDEVFEAIYKGISKAQKVGRIKQW